MEKLFDCIKLLIMASGTGLTWLLGVWDMLLITLVIFMILDIMALNGYTNIK